MRSIMILIAIRLILFPAVSLQAAIIHVPADQPTIQAGVDVAMDGDMVLVADGLYSGPGNKNIDPWGRAITIRSENGPLGCIIDCEDYGRGFYIRAGEGRDTVIQGFTIRGGDPLYSWPDTHGGGIKCNNTSPTIRDNIITGNHGYSGGGICCYHQSAPLIVNNIIDGNTAYLSGGGIQCYDLSDPIIVGNAIIGNVGGGGVSCMYSSPLIEDNIISGNIDDSGSGGGIGIGGLDSNPIVRNNTINGNTALDRGGGIYCVDYTEARITGNTIQGNQSRYGAGISFDRCSPVFTENSVVENMAEIYGGGIHVDESSPEISGNLVRGNSAYWGGGIYCRDESSPFITNCTILENEATARGGGICCIDSNPVITGTIFWSNSAETGNEMYLGLGTEGSALAISYSDVEGGQDSAFVEPGSSLDWGPGMIQDNPLFIAGPQGDYYLSQTVAGQAVDSPCVDTGDPANELIPGTTRTDEMEDLGIVDMGYHYPMEAEPFVITGPGPGYNSPPLVRVFPPWQDAELEYEFSAYDPDHYGVNVTTGDVTGDQLDDILTGAGPGEIYGPHVRGFEVNGTPLPGLSFLAYGTSKWGVNVAAGDIDGDGFDEIITGAGPGAVFGPHVRGWDYDGTGSVTAMTGVNYFAYGTPKWGVNVSAGDIDGDGYDEIVTGAGPGSVYGPHVRGWDYDNTAIAAIPSVSFMAYGTNQFGVNVSCGDVDGDGIDEIVTAPGPGSVFGAHIRGWDYDGSSVTPLPGLSFFAWEYPGARYGATVFAGADLDGDGRDDLVVGGGPDPSIATPVSVFRYDGEQVSPWFTLEGYEGMTHGTSVAAGRF